MKRAIALVLALMMVLAVPTALADKASVSEWAKTEADKLPEDARAVNVYTWMDYVPTQIITEFEDASGIKVNFTPFASLDEMMTKLQSAPGQYDIVICNDFLIATMVNEGMLSEIDASRLPNYQNVDPLYQGQYYDPDNKFSIPYTNCAPIIAYDSAAIDFTPTKFADLWREEFKGGLVMAEDSRLLMGICEKKLGMSFNETDPEKLGQAKEELLTLKDNIAVFSADTPNTALVGGDAIAGVMYGSQYLAAKAELDTVEIAYPEEGVPFFIDNYAMPVNGPHADAAYIFLNYMLDGEVAANTAEIINYSHCNTAAGEYIVDKEKMEALSVPADVLAKAETMKDLDADTLKLFDEIWTEFKMK